MTAISTDDYIRHHFFRFILADKFYLDGDVFLGWAFLTPDNEKKYIETQTIVDVGDISRGELYLITAFRLGDARAGLLKALTFIFNRYKTVANINYLSKDGAKITWTRTKKNRWTRQ